MDVDPTGSHALSGRADYITRIDFDGDFDARNNWENAGSASCDGSTYGALRAAVAVVHTDFCSFVRSGSSWSAGTENVDGGLQMVSYEGGAHPGTAQESKGHGLKARSLRRHPRGRRHRVLPVGDRRRGPDERQ